MASAYRLGLATPVRTVRTSGDYRTGMIVVTSGSGVLGTGMFANLVEELDSVRAEMDAVEHEMFEQTQGIDLHDPREEFYRGVWEPFYLSFRDFEDNHRKLIARTVEAISPLFGRATFQDIQGFRARLIAMHDAAKTVGFTFTSPDPTPPKQDDLRTLGGGLTDVIHTLLIVVVVVAAGWLLVQLLRMGGARGAGAVASLPRRGVIDV